MPVRFSCSVPFCFHGGKLVPAGLQSHSLGGDVTGSLATIGSLGASKLISVCPHADVVMGGVTVTCLVDTGSMVSTVSESFFRQHMESWGSERLQSCHWLELRAANGLKIPYIGYLELDVYLCGKLIPHCGVLVVQDPCGEVPAKVPGVLGMNVIRKCYQELFGLHGVAWSSVSGVSEAPQSVMQALQQCQFADSRESRSGPGRVKVRGKKGCRIPGGVMKIVAATCSDVYAGSTVLFEPLESGLPSGLLASPALVQVIKGTAYVPIINVGTTELVVYPRTVVGTLNVVNVVSLPAGITEVPAKVATMVCQTASVNVQQQVEDLDLSSLSVEGQGQVRSLLNQYMTVFSSHDGDLGCTNVIAHDIPLIDDVPVKQRYRRIPPSDYEVVKDHINQLLASQIIRESSSPYASPIVLVRYDSIVKTATLAAGINGILVKPDAKKPYQCVEALKRLAAYKQAQSQKEAPAQTADPEDSDVHRFIGEPWEIEGDGLIVFTNERYKIHNRKFRTDLKAKSGQDYQQSVKWLESTKGKGFSGDIIMINGYNLPYCVVIFVPIDAYRKGDDIKTYRGKIW
ncbi:uncharacterized protein LOC114137209 [Xiphophorus couchianus]|uniref:uncharacterized protein LOC114137209 n=1 Tax=Xiphophorus couchianus TaxID=32473 RepID=UPI00101665EC|nr:uncharacterized protein LOC114137209 [Xiphophorus couchianus]